MTAYLRFMKDTERADWLTEKAEELTAMLKCRESVRVEQYTILTPERVETHAEENDITHDDACEQLATHYVEQWAKHEWVNS